VLVVALLEALDEHAVMERTQPRRGGLSHGAGASLVFRVSVNAAGEIVQLCTVYH
jgi:hypothetical protein